VTKGISSAARKPRKLKQPWASMSPIEWESYFAQAYEALAQIRGHILTKDERDAFREFLNRYLAKNGLLGANPRNMATVYDACGDWFVNPALAPDAIGKVQVRDPKAKAAALASRKVAR